MNTNININELARKVIKENKVALIKGRYRQLLSTVIVKELLEDNTLVIIDKQMSDGILFRKIDNVSYLTSDDEIEKYFKKLKANEEVSNESVLIYESVFSEELAKLINETISNHKNNISFVIVSSEINKNLKPDNAKIVNLSSL